MWFYGWQGGWPLQWGGGPSAIEIARETLFANVGVGHAAKADGVDWRWREAKAGTYAALASLMEQAVAQHQPATATAALEFWRECYDVPNGLDDQQAREICSTRFSHEFNPAACPSVLERLQEIDPRFSIIVRDDADEVVTYPAARAFQDYEGAVPFNFPDGRDHSLAPMYSTRAIWFIHLDTDFPEDGTVERVAVEDATAFLQEEIPAWCDFQITGGDQDGFDLDVDNLDWTALTEE